MIAQLGIAVFGLTAVALTQSASPKHRRFACIAGLLGQPFWIAETVGMQKWGMFALTLVYTFIWGERGVELLDSSEARVKVFCTRCPAQYDDAQQWTLCPHPLRPHVAAVIRFADLLESDATLNVTRRPFPIVPLNVK